MEHTRISLPAGPLSPFGPSVALDRAVVASALTSNPRAGEALALAASAILYFRHHRAELLAFAEIVTDLADMVDGDPDFEDAQDAEDDHALSPDALFYGGSGAGCGISDPGEPDGTQCDTSWTEWQSRGARKDDPGVHSKCGHQLHEDAEDDDPDTGVEDEVIPLQAVLRRQGYGPGCDLGDPGGDEHDGREPCETSEV